MTADSVSARYAQALFDVAKPSGQLEPSLAALEELAGLLRGQDALRRLLLNPRMAADEKLGLCERLLRNAWPEDARAFIRVVLSFGRAELLIEMAEALRRLVDEDHHVVRATVRTAHPLSAALRERLIAALERSERRTVLVVEEAAPELIGGLQIFLNHRLLDGSLQTRVAELRQRLKRVKIN